MTAAINRRALIAAGVLPLAAPLPAVAVCRPAPEDDEAEARRLYNLTQEALDRVHARTGLPEEYRPKLCISYRIPLGYDD